MTNQTTNNKPVTNEGQTIKMVHIGNSTSGKGIHMSERMLKEYMDQGFTKEQLAKYFGA